MGYRVNELAVLANISTRTLRYYDQIGLLTPERADSNGYRIYGQVQIDRLQEILFYRELGFPLEEIKQFLECPDFDKEKSLESHLSALLNKKERIEALINNVTKTIRSMKEGLIMSDKEKFEGFKKDLINENTTKYGDEVIKKYGKEVFDASNERLSGMTKEQWDEQELLSEKIFEYLETAIKNGDPACEAAQTAADLHRRWICMFWKEGTYSKQAHSCLADGYVSDERFTSFYDKRLGQGATKFLRDSIVIYANQ